MRRSKVKAGPVSARGLIVAVVIASVPQLAQCDRVRDGSPTPPETGTSAPPETPPPVVAPKPPVAVDRAEMISAGARAASAYAAGEALKGVDPLVGRTFAVRVPFGCGSLPEASGSSADGLARAAWSADRQIIQLNLAPGDWSDSALLSSARAEAGWEAVEGFWIPRPWLATEVCPSIQRDPLQAGVAPTATAQTIGLAAIFKEGASRAGRRNGRAYAYTVRSSGETPPTPPAGGYRLVMEGRVTGFPDGRAFRCRSDGPDQRPVCVAAVELDRVAFADAAGAVLGEWRTD